MIFDTFCRIILISIPEQAFLILFILKTAGKTSRLLASTNRNYLYGLIVFQGIVSNIPKLLGVNQGISFTFNLVITLILIQSIERFEFKKALLFAILVFFLFALFDTTCALIITKSAHITIDAVNKNLLLAFGATLLERAIDFFIIYCLYVARTSFYGISIKLMDIFLWTKKNHKIAITTFAINITFIILEGYAFMVWGVLNNLRPEVALMLSVLTLSMPFLTLTYFIYLSKNKYIENKVFLKYFTKDIEEQIIEAIESSAKSGDMETVEMLKSLLIRVNVTD